MSVGWMKGTNNFDSQKLWKAIRLKLIFISFDLKSKNNEMENKNKSIECF